MHYLSPASLFGDAIPTTLDKKAIQLARKRLFADLELNADHEIELHGKIYGKNDIIQYFEDLLKENTLDYHNAIQLDPTLKTFLEEKGLDPNAHFSSNPLYKDPAFIRWVSPYFLSSFTSFIEHCFVQKDAAGLSTLLANPLLLTQPDEEKSWKGTTQRISDDITNLKSFEDDSKNKIRPGVKLNTLFQLMKEDYNGLILLLPEIRFGVLRDRYSFAMMQVCIRIYNEHQTYRSSVMGWLKNAHNLAVSPDRKEQIKDKAKEINALLKKGRSKYVGRIILAIIIGIRIITAIFEANKSQTTKLPQFQAPIILPSPTDTLRFYADTNVRRPSVIPKSNSPIKTPTHPTHATPSP